jgi:hypothetical protein
VKTIDNDFMTIKDESDDQVKRFVLYVGKSRESTWVGNRMAVTQDRKNGRVTFHTAFHGPVQFEEMKLILEGMLELFVIADELESHQEVTRGKKKT